VESPAVMVRKDLPTGSNPNGEGLRQLIRMVLGKKKA